MRISAGLPTAGCEARFPPALVIPATRSIEPEPVFRACLAEASGEAQVGRSRFSLENPSRVPSARFRDSF